MKVLLVDDDPVFTATLADDLSGLGDQVAVAGDGRAALAAIDQDAFDAVVLDRMMPRVDGIALVERLRSDARSIPVIMLSARGASADKITGLAAGADDYVVKPVEAAELHARLQAVVRGRQWTREPSDTLRAGDIVVSPTRFRAWRNDQPIELAKLELKLLAELVRSAGTVLTRAMLIERVWGYDFEPDTNLVDVYIRRLRQKLTAGGGEDPIQTMRGVGYMLRD
ncbi:MAG: response regulator transcription factor [Sphingomonas taxi]